MQIEIGWDFKRTRALMMGLALAGALLAAGTMRAQTRVAGTARAIVMTATGEGFDPKRITADPGEALTIELTNESSREIDLVVELPDGGLERMPPVPPRATGELVFDAPAEAGIYTFYSDMSGARAAGYLGALVVGEVDTIRVEGFNFAYAPDILRVKAGEWVNIEFTSTNGFHDLVFWLDDDRIEASARIATGATTYMTFLAPELSASYTFFCSISDHRDLGMEGRLIVEEAEAAPTATVSGEATFTPTDEAGGTPTATETPVGPSVEPPVETPTPADSATPATSPPTPSHVPTEAPVEITIYLPSSRRDDLFIVQP